MSTSHRADDPRYLPSLETPINEVLPGKLWIGNLHAREHVAAHGIDVVVCCTRQADHYLLPGLPANVKEHILYLADVSVHEDTFVNDMFDLGCAHITAALKQQRRVLVHCLAGVSRSASIVTAYLMRPHDGAPRSFNDAFQMLEDARFCVWPNPQFTRVLRAREHKEH